VSEPTAGTVSGAQRALAWSIHGLTASGAIFALVALLAATEGAFSLASLLMLAALAIDSVDGTLARAARVEERAPRIDGRRLDDIVDYLNYVIVPAVFMVSAGNLSHWAWAALPVAASAYGFSQTSAKTDDHFFLGFPSYWNVIAIYLWLFDIPPAASAAIVSGFAALVFVPFKYVYPSRLAVLYRTTIVLAALWMAGMAIAVLHPERAASGPWVELSLVFPAYYLALSARLGGLHRAG